jgi:uncharacterized protein (DUF983 family)
MKKKCSKCGIEKDVKEFYKNRNSCNDCRKEHHKKWKELLKTKS